jgi:integrase
MTKFSSKLSPKLVSRFLDELALINGKYGYATDPLEKRVRWIEELELLGRIAREIHPVIKLLLEPLDALITALYVLEHGVAEPPLQPAKLKHRPQDPNWSYFRGGAAAASELLIGHGAAASVADAWVAKRLSRDGHQKPFGNSDRRITAVTVKGWRDLVALETFKEGMRYFLDRNGNKRTAGIGSLTAALMAIARHHVRVEPPQLERLVALSRRLAPDRRGGLTETNRARLRQLDDPGNVRALLLLPAALMRRAARNPDRRRGAIEAQLAVAIEILFMTAMRIGNLAQLDLDLNFVRPGRSNAVHIVIEAERVKNRESLEYPLPTQSAQILERYVQEFRPCLAPPSSSALFPARNGRPKRTSWLGRQISGVIWKHIGLRINPHLFRHCGGKLFLECNPGGHEVVRRVLAHRSIDTTNSYYTGLQTAAAVRHFDETILKLRGDDRPPAPKP